MRLSELKGKAVGIWGAGREGTAVLEALRDQDPQVRATVFSDDDGDLRDRIGSCDVVVRSPGVSIYRPEIAEARASGVVFTTATNLALAELPLERVIGVTGTKGKSTTSSLIAHLLRTAGKNALLAGNIGVPILRSLRESVAAEFYVVELSSYQIADLEQMPRFAVLTNLYRDHLTWHHTVAQYHRDKFRLFSSSEQTVVFNAADPQTLEYAGGFPGTIVWYNSPGGVHVDGDDFIRDRKRLFPTSAVRLPGRHNLSNVCAALTLVAELGVSLDSAEDALSRFSGLPHRLAILGEHDGRLYVDDSISTVPETALAALECFSDRPVSLILGGLDRGQDWPAFARSVRGAPPRMILTVPDNGAAIAKALRDAGVASEIVECASLQDAVTSANQSTPRGGVVLLSPGSASFTHFRNFEERGSAFAKFAGFR